MSKGLMFGLVAGLLVLVVPAISVILKFSFSTALILCLIAVVVVFLIDILFSKKGDD